MPDELGGPCRCVAFSWSSANRWTFLLHSFSYLLCHCAFFFPTHSHRTRCCSHCTRGRVFPQMQEGKLLLYYYYWHCWKSPSGRGGSMRRLQNLCPEQHRVLDDVWKKQVCMGGRKGGKKAESKLTHRLSSISLQTTPMHLGDLPSPQKLCKPGRFHLLRAGQAMGGGRKVHVQAEHITATHCRPPPAPAS